MRRTKFEKWYNLHKEELLEEQRTRQYRKEGLIKKEYSEEELAKLKKYWDSTNHRVQNLRAAIQGKKEEDFFSVLTQWTTGFCDIETYKHSNFCLCQTGEKNQLFFLLNQKEDDILGPIGMNCLKHFGNSDLIKDCEVWSSLHALYDVFKNTPNSIKTVYDKWIYTPNNMIISKAYLNDNNLRFKPDNINTLWDRGYIDEFEAMVLTYFSKKQKRSSETWKDFLEKLQKEEPVQYPFMEQTIQKLKNGKFMEDFKKWYDKITNLISTKNPYHHQHS